MTAHRHSWIRALQATLRSRGLWLVLFMVIASAAATLVVGMELYGYTSTPMIFNNR